MSICYMFGLVQVGRRVLKASQLFSTPRLFVAPWGMSAQASAKLPCTILKRTGVASYEGLLIEMSKPPKWSRPTCLLRFVEVSGASTVFLATGAALQALEACELGKAYSMQVPGRQVRTSGGPQKYGVHGPYEVHLQEPPAQLHLCKS